MAIALLLIGAAGENCAQSAQDQPTGSLTGKLTDLRSKPLNGVVVVVRNQATGAEARTTTARNGAYSFNALAPGEYTLQAESPELGSGHVEGLQVSAGHEARVQAAIDFEIGGVSPVVAASHEDVPLAPEFRSASSPQHLPLGHAPSAVGSSVANSVAFTAKVADEPATHPGPSHTVEAAGGNGGSATASMSAAELQALPVSGRHWQDFISGNAPTSATPAGGQAPASLAGARPGQTAIAVDGASHELAFGSASSSSQGSTGQGPVGQGGNGPAGIGEVNLGGHGIAVTEAAIREVQSAAGDVEVEASNAAAGRMSIQTQRGGDTLHGQGFLFTRQSTWDAQNPFTQWITETSPAVLAYNPLGPPLSVPVFGNGPNGASQSYTPPDRETVWGLGAGSRIRREKLFWFAALDGYSRNDPAISMVKHPYLAQPVSGCTAGQCTEETGFFAQPTNDQMQVLCARLGMIAPGQPAICGNALVQGLTAYSGMLETLAGLLGPATRTASQLTGFGRLDWQAAERHRFTLEGIGAHWNSPGGGLTRVSENYGNHSFGSTRASEEWLLGRWETYLTPNLLAVTQASAGHTVEEAHPGTPSQFEQGLLSGNAWGQLPQIVVDSRYGFTIGNPSRFGTGSYPDERAYQAQESLDWVRGKLLMKTGFDFSRSFDATSLLRNQTGTYTYSNVENFASDALVFENFGFSSDLNPINQRNCDQTGKVWRDSAGGLRGAGSLPCYSYYSQTIGPPDWHLSTNDWAGYATTEWQAKKLLVVSAGLRWEREQLPPPIAALAIRAPLLTQRLPDLGNSWGPRISLAVGSGEGRWPLLRLGYGMFFGRTENAALETALTQTGSFKGDLNYFIRPTDGLNPPTGTSAAPPFPYVLQGVPGNVIKPGAVEFASRFHNPEVHQGIASFEEKLPSHVEITASAMASLGRRLPISIDINLPPPSPLQTITYAVVDTTSLGPIKASAITVPFYASWPSPFGDTGRLNPDYQQIAQIMSRANSIYEAAVLKVVRSSRRGLSLRANYTYSHAMDWNPNESSQVAGDDVLDPASFGLEYGTSDLDARHSAAATAIYQTPWKLKGTAGRLGNGWMLSGVGHFRSGMPFTMRTSGSLAKAFPPVANGREAVIALGPGMNGSGGDNRVYGLGSDGLSYNIGRNTYRYRSTWKADLRLARSFDLGEMRQLEVLAESFNLFNHQNVTEVETTGYLIESGTTEGAPPTLNFLNGLKANTTAFGQPLDVNATNFYRPRQFQFGLRMRF